MEPNTDTNDTNDTNTMTSKCPKCGKDCARPGAYCAACGTPLAAINHGYDELMTLGRIHHCDFITVEELIAVMTDAKQRGFPTALKLSYDWLTTAEVDEVQNEAIERAVEEAEDDEAVADAEDTDVVMYHMAVTKA